MLATELLEAASHSVEAKLGLHFPPERWNDLERGLRGAAIELGYSSVEEYARGLVLCDANKTQIDSLAGQLTIGETYFMRDPKAFEALEKHILPAIIQERQGGAKRLRIWSAGCCSGEEAYSIAFALRRTIPDLDDWQVTILATDVNPKFLHKASEGVYGQWSFRGVPDEIKKYCVRQTAQGKFEVLPALKKMVTFGCLNLVEDVYPSLVTNTNAMDIIFCRNVLMYFSPDQLRKVIANLHRSLMEGGWLFVSASEASQQMFADFSPAGFEGTAVYRKGAAPHLTLPVPPVMTWNETVLKETLPLRPSKLAEPLVALPCIQEPSATWPNHLAEAKQLANKGCLVEALVACDRAIEADRLVASSYCLRGVILQEQNADEEAITALKRALYLDHDCVIAHFMLGNLMRRQGRSRDAARCFENARALLTPCAPDSEVLDSDGLTAGRLLAIIHTLAEVAE